MTEAPPLLAIRDLSNAYVSRPFALFGAKEVKSVLKHVSLDIAPGEIFGLSGESGCGKTTLARCVLGLIAYEGEIRINGEPRARRLALSRNLPAARQAQMVFQESGASLNPSASAGR